MIAVFVCTQNDTMWKGKVYHKGQLYDGPWEDSPVNQLGWGQRPPLPSEISPNDNLGLGGRTSVSWRRGGSTPTVQPVVVGRDPLRDELIIDEEATRQRQIDVDEVNRRLNPPPTADENRKRQIEYWQLADPSLFEDYLEQFPEEAVRLGFVNPAPEEVQDISTELTPTPPGEPVA